jgi:hypothetical protein
VAPFKLDYDPMATDPGRWGHSLGNLGELLFACLDAAAPRSLVEVGAYAGDVTQMLVAWAAGATTERLVSIDPEPQPALVALATEHPELELVRRTSVDALPDLAPADAYIIDGDHNYYTVSQELRLIDRASPGRLPLLLCHDVCWPHARRDAYYTPEAIPDEQRRATAHGAYLFPGVSGLHDGGLIYKWAARQEGGERNGVLTAIEDFVASRELVRLCVVPAFFGLGVAWHTDKPWSDELAAVLDPFDRHPVLERLEANRVAQLARGYSRQVEIWELQRRLARQQAVLQRLLDSSAFGVAERLSRLRAGAGIATEQSVVSKDEIRSVINDRDR